MDSHTTTTTSKPFQANCSSSSPIESPCTRVGEMKRVTNETNVSVKFNLDGTGIADSATDIPFLDHMLDHGLFDVHVRATGDIHIDDHHTNEDVALAIGTALLQALGDRKGTDWSCDFPAPLVEALIHVSLDLSGRPYLGYDLQIPNQGVGTYDTQLKRGSIATILLHYHFKNDGLNSKGKGRSSREVVAICPFSPFTLLKLLGGDLRETHTENS